jgi:hypothetical protein
MQAEVAGELPAQRSAVKSSLHSPQRNLPRYRSLLQELLADNRFRGLGGEATEVTEIAGLLISIAVL